MGGVASDGGSSTTRIPVVDLFAGPGGLGEGFSALRDAEGQQAFDIRLSIEADQHAHRTLELRSFFRQFDPGCAPDDYYAYLRGDVARDELFGRHPEEARLAKREAWRATLGAHDPKTVRARIENALDGAAHWALIGGPPCQAYSVVGRSRMLSKLGETERAGRPFDSDHRHLLYVQYLRVLAEHGPPVFVMENVPGLLTAKLNGHSTFRQIARDLRSPATAAAEHGFGAKYKDLEYELFPAFASRATDFMTNREEDRDPRTFLVRSEEYGIPQARHRVIVIGVRRAPESVVLPAAPPNKPNRDPVTVRDVISDLPMIRSQVSPRGHDSQDRWVREVGATAHYLKGLEPQLGLTADVIRLVREAAVTVRTCAPNSFGGAFMAGTASADMLDGWYFDPRLGGFCNHEARSHMPEDLRRYFFAAAFAKAAGRSPTLRDFPDVLMPEHRSAGSRSMFADRFRVQLADQRATTVTSHIAKDGHYYIHYDPYQCRSLTVREAARLQTFPDNYFFEGPRTAQYQQVGNAVPPRLAYEIAKTVLCFLRAGQCVR